MDLELALRFGWRIIGIVGIITLVVGKRSESSGAALSGVLMILAAVIMMIISMNR